ncbi:MAG: hypothetical protein KBT33_04150 [Prevotellaceae bacterium]|nr:hypothetical protein [Candidatus Minthosoma equi]
MKKILFSLVALVASMSMNAQVMKVMKNGVEVAKYKGANYTVVFEEEPPHEYVDLGLSVKWATCNVGADSPEEFGLYFAWGETTGYDKDNLVDIYWNNYKWGTPGNDGLNFGSLKKYNDTNGYGPVDNLTTLEAADDAAVANWGDGWHMPTKAEMEELVNNCTWTITTHNGVSVCKVEASNGNFIFLPIAGYSSSGRLQESGNAYYWTSSLSIYSYPVAAHCLSLMPTMDMKNVSNKERYEGLPVRAVCQ